MLSRSIAQIRTSDQSLPSTTPTKDGFSRAALRRNVFRSSLTLASKRRRLAVAEALPKEADVIVVGAGIAGLSAALQLQKSGVNDVLVLESSDAALLDYEALDLKPFYAGADVWWNGDFHRVADPLRHLVDGLMSLTNPIGSVGDKVNVGIFRLRCLLGTADELLQKEETTTIGKLKAEGFSDDMINRFFRPFLGGIFFDRSLSMSSRLFAWVMRMLATGSNCLPSEGIGAVVKQMEARLPSDSIVCGAKVDKVVSQSAGTPAQVFMSDGSVIIARKAVIVAVEGPEAKRLLGESIATSPSKEGPGVGTCNLYYKAPKSPSPLPILFLNGEDVGIVNNCCFPSVVSPSYAPPGQTLVSVSTIGTYDELSDEALDQAVRKHLSKWFGSKEVDEWGYLRTYRIPFAQPSQTPPTNFFRPVDLGGGILVCGDHRDSATLDGAIKSGIRAANAV
eukprot:gene27169-2409_t